MAVPSTVAVQLTNDSAGQANMGFRWKSQGAIGNITATASAIPVDIPDFAGKVTNIVLLMQGGVDTTNVLSLTVGLKKNGTAVATTAPVISYRLNATTIGASTGSQSTYAASTGVTQVTLKTDGTEQFAAGDIFTVDFTVARTASPGTEMSQPEVIVYGQRFTS